jgi:ubiquinone/menaquinone biosynthesis C-methylase UbiE
MKEALRVLKPGGALVIAGEPTRIGFKIVGLAKRATAELMKSVGSRVGLARAPGEVAHDDPESRLEPHVDLHEFHPHMVKAMAREAGFDNVRVETEELFSGVFGWSVRTIEALAKPGALPDWWPWFAYRNYLRLYWLDYNLMLYAEKPKPTE